MKVRIKFSKSGALVYIGHLDVMRYFQKLFRRADIPVAYSEGFSPHQLLSFTPPLPLGMESDGEYADVELTSSVKTKDALETLRKESVPEISIKSFRELPEKCLSAMASVSAAKYTVKSVGNDAWADMDKKIGSFLDKDEAIITKKTKKNEREVNIRPLVYELGHNNDSGTTTMLISSGSTDNLKPEHVLQYLGVLEHADCDPDDLLIRRIDQYTFVDGTFISLDDLGHDIL